jgi:hypothetical protein
MSRGRPEAETEAEDPRPDAAQDVASDTDSETDDEETASDDYEHLKSLEDGAGCTEVWEHLSANRDE